MSATPLPRGVAAAFIREVARARDGRRAWPRLLISNLERALAPHEAEIVAALAEAGGVRGKISAAGVVAVELTRDGRLQRGTYDARSGLWSFGDTSGTGVVGLAARMWSHPGSPVDAERAAERLTALLGRAAVSSLADC